MKCSLAAWPWAPILLGAGSLRPGVGRNQRIALILLSLCLSAWLICESQTAREAFGQVRLLVPPFWAGGGAFWLFVLTVFEDARVTPLTLSPGIAQLMLGGVASFLPPGLAHAGWWGINGIAGVLALHLCVVVARGWSGDLIEGRRQLRGLLLGAAAVFALTSVVMAFAVEFDPTGPWLQFTAGRFYGGVFVSMVILATAIMFTQLRSSVFGTARRPVASADARAEAANRLMLEKLRALMDAGGWRPEGLTIGQVATELGEPEHRVRRLINQGLGHRNFADFVNSYRIQAAQQRLDDPAQARTTVAAIAFDLGYGSLGPFNRAFREATGSTPTEWRRQVLAASPDMQEAV